MDEEYVPPLFHFVVRVRGRAFGEGGGSGYLRMLDVLELHMRDLDPSTLVDRRGRVRLADGSVQQLRVAADGRVSLRGVAPGPFELEFESYPEEF